MNSVGEGTNDISHEDFSRKPSRALFPKKSQAESLKDWQLKHLQNRNINFEQPEGQSENTRISGVVSQEKLYPQKLTRKRSKRKSPNLKV